MKYPKINTLFKRDEKNHIILDAFTTPEFEYLKNNEWECTEKIDGTNIRIELEPDGKVDLSSITKAVQTRLRFLNTCTKNSRNCSLLKR